jgi:DNA-binding NarL/FixJ family response regulator
VFAQVAEGKPNKVIARELGVTEGAVKNYMTKLLDATGASNRGEAIKLYIENIERWRADPRYREAMRARD